MGDVTRGPGVEAGRSDRTELRLLHTLLDQLPALVAYWTADCRNVVANQAHVEYFGLEPEQVRGMHISEVLGPDVYAMNLPFVTAALAGHEQLFDRTLIDQSGRTRHTQACYVPDGEGGVVGGFFVLVTDVTPRVEAQRAMDEAQAIAKFGSWELEVATGVMSWSRNLHQVFGPDPGGAAPVLLPAGVVHIHTDDRARVLANLEQAITSGEPYVSSYRIITGDGSHRDVVSRGKPLVGIDGRVTRIKGTMQDVTETNAAARHLARINGELRAANELNADVIAMLGHDLRNPLTAVLAHLEELDDAWASLDDDQRRHSASRARAATERLSVIVERMLGLAAIDSGGISPVREDLELPGVLEEIARDSGLLGLPAIEMDHTAPASFSFDRVHLQQVLANLLTNAFRYGSEPVRVLVTGAGDRIEIAVTDAGPGVRTEEIGALFARFARTGVAQMAIGGTGFGLYLSAQLAEANGAKLSYRAAEGDRSHAFVLTGPARPGVES